MEDCKDPLARASSLLLKDVNKQAQAFVRLFAGQIAHCKDLIGIARNLIPAKTISAELALPLLSQPRLSRNRDKCWRSPGCLHSLRNEMTDPVTARWRGVALADWAFAF